MQKCKNIHLSKCNKFGIKNLLSGEIEYETAIRCRYDKSMCSEKAIYFSEKWEKNEIKK